MGEKKKRKKKKMMEKKKKKKEKKKKKKKKKKEREKERKGTDKKEEEEDGGGEEEDEESEEESIQIKGTAASCREPKWSVQSGTPYRGAHLLPAMPTPCTCSFSFLPDCTDTSFSRRLKSSGVKLSFGSSGP